MSYLSRKSPYFRLEYSIIIIFIQIVIFNINMDNLINKCKLLLIKI